MARRMLINAFHSEEIRIAISENDELTELEVERANSGQLRGNIYKSTITRIEPSLQAAFLDIGSERNGFLQINDIHPSYFKDWPPEDHDGKSRLRPSIQDVLDPGQDLIVQVVKDGRDAKGATLSTNLSLPGRYLVLMVGNQRGGVSRKINDEGQRQKLRAAVDRLVIPSGMGVIVRTAGINRSFPELERDLNSLLDLWSRIVEQSFKKETPNLLYEEAGLAIRTIRDYLSPDIDEILIDEEKTYNYVKDFVGRVMPEAMDIVKFYKEPQPLFSKFLLDTQVDATNSPEVTLPSGGSIVITPTEAVVTIDVNSGRATSQSDVEETAFATNKEAAQVIAKQLRLRDLGGLVVIDFIDMWDKRHKQQVERTLKDAVRCDKAKVEMGRISKFGLLEMSRQRLKASLVSQSHTGCPHCNGSGRVKTADSAALEALRKIQSAVFAGGVKEVRVRMAPSAALFLLNNKRQLLSRLEQETETSILVYADGRMKPEEYRLELDSGKEISNIPEQQARDGEQSRDRDRRGRPSNRRRSNDRGQKRGNSRGSRNNDRRGSGNRRGAKGSQNRRRNSGGNNRNAGGNRSRRPRNDDSRSNDGNVGVSEDTKPKPKTDSKPVPSSTETNVVPLGARASDEG